MPTGLINWSYNNILRSNIVVAYAFLMHEIERSLELRRGMDQKTFKLLCRLNAPYATNKGTERPAFRTENQTCQQSGDTTPELNS